MVADLIRDSSVGTWLRWTAAGRKALPYPEDKPDFQCPKHYSEGQNGSENRSSSPTGTLVGDPNAGSRKGDKNSTEKGGKTDALNTKERKPEYSEKNQKNKPQKEEALEAGGVPNKDSPQDAPKTGPPGTILVDWYGEDDPAHPWNWSGPKKAFVAFDILFLTFNVYGGSSIITSSFPILQTKFGIGTAEVTTLLSLYVFAYGFGALVFSPLSEIPKLGRNVFYIYPMILFVCLQAGASTVKTFYGLCILRFLTGFMGAPCLATGAATLQDVFPPAMLGPVISFWALAAFAAPSTAPTMSNYAVFYLNDWRWSMYILLIQVAITTALLAFLPETSHSFILLKRAQRLRKLTGNKQLLSQAEINQAQMTPSGIFLKAIVRPTEIFLKDPAITYVHIYTAFIYGIYYLFFTSYPIVYEGIYGWSFPVEALGYLAFLVGGSTACIIYLAYLGIRLGPIFKRGEQPLPEQWLDAALVSTVLAPIGSFIFAWSARKSVHWAVSLVGVMIFGGANFVTIQCLFSYILSVYPTYGASLLAGNDFLRSSTAAGLLFGGVPMFEAWGIGPGNSFLGGLLFLGTVGAYGIWYFGARLRARSKFAD